MSGLAEGALCSHHPQEPAVEACGHCGDFLCRACCRKLVRTRLVYCESCLERRAQHVSAQRIGGNQLDRPRTTLGLAVISLIPCMWPAWIGSIWLGITCLREAKESRNPGFARLAGRLGILLPLVSVVLSFVLFASLGMLD